MNPNDLASLVQTRLQASEALRKELIGLALSWIENQTVSQLAEPDVITTILSDALTSEFGQQQIALEMEHLFNTEESESELGNIPLGDAIPDTVVTAIEARLGRPFSYPSGILDDVLDPAFVRRILGEALADTLEDFVQRSPLAGSSGVLGSLARGAGRMGQKGSSFLSGVGAELQKSLSVQAKDFAHRSADTFRQQLMTRLRASENAAEFAAARHQLLKNILLLRWADLRDLGADPGPDELSGWLQQIIVQNLNREEVLTAIKQYIDNRIHEHGDLSVRELLEKANVRTQVAELLTRHGDRAITTVVNTSEFHAWLAKCFSDPDES